VATRSSADKAPHSSAAAEKYKNNIQFHLKNIAVEKHEYF